MHPLADGIDLSIDGLDEEAITGVGRDGRGNSRGEARRMVRHLGNVPDGVVDKGTELGRELSVRHS
jgi:hypothetical protein